MSGKTKTTVIDPRGPLQKQAQEEAWKCV